MPRPNFFIVGAPKCGTTALYDYLRGHPQAFLSVPKEPHYFAPDLPGYRDVSSREAYEYLFAGASAQQWRIGEASVFYMFSREAAQRVRQYAPQARIICMLRNPLELVPSFHAQLLYSRDEDEPSLERAWQLMPRRRIGERIPRHCRAVSLLRYDRVARLGEQLERWLDQFGPEQVKVVFFDDLRADPDATFLEVLRFLKLPDDGRRGQDRVNARRGHRWSWLADFTQRTPQPLIQVAMAAKRLVGCDRLGILDRLRRWNSAPVNSPTPSPWLREALTETYADDIARLSRLTGRPLDAWLADSSECVRRVGEDSQELANVS